MNNIAAVGETKNDKNRFYFKLIKEQKRMVFR